MNIASTRKEELKEIQDSDQFEYNDMIPNTHEFQHKK